MFDYQTKFNLFFLVLMFITNSLFIYVKSLGISMAYTNKNQGLNKKFNSLWLGKHNNFYIIQLNYVLKSIKQIQTISFHMRKVKGFVLFATVTEQYRGIVYASAKKAGMPCSENVWQYGSITNYLKQWRIDISFVPDLQSKNESILRELRRMSIPIIGIVSPSVFFKVDYPLYGLINSYNILFYSNLIASIIKK